MVTDPVEELPTTDVVVPTPVFVHPPFNVIFHLRWGQALEGDVGFNEPPDPPPIQNFYWQDSMERIVFNWPWGWKLAGIDADNIPGSSIWATTYTYEFQWAVLPR